VSTQSAGGPRPAGRLLPGGPGVRFATALARRPHRVAHRATILAGDLAHVGLGRSTLVEYLADSGQQVFVVSWRNPDARHRDWGADTYGQAILEALAATRRICRVDRSALLGLRSGGILAVMALAHLAATGQRERVAGFALAVANALTRPGEAALLGSPVDLVAGAADHLCPWQACDRSTQLLGGHTRFVLSSGGNIAAMVDPPGTRKASFRTGPDNPPDPADWLDRVTTEAGSWWPDLVGWLDQRGGGEKTRPRRLGAAGLPPLDPAPGTYVRDR
jgi:poly(3-hydroxyalkanoate) synthetase